MWEVCLESFSHLVNWPGPLILLSGTLAGLVFGAIPGLNGPILLALLIPVTLPLGPMGAMILVGSVMGAVTFGGSVSAILLNAPGTETNAATCIEGFPLAQQGKAPLALGAAAISSAVGGILGLILMVLVMPYGYDLILLFSYPENFMLTFFGISLIAVVAKGQLLKGLISGGVGLMLAFIGQDPFTGQPRYVFGIDYLWDGIGFIPALIGLFAVSEALDMMVRGGKITSPGKTTATFGLLSSAMSGVKAVLQNFWLFLRSSVVGFLIGIIPGVGGTVATFVAYMLCVQTTKDKSKFGKGDIRGVIATESANDAKDGGALLPTLLLGLPGSAVMAVLLGVFLLHGITPGPQVLTEDLDLVATLIDAHLVGNLLVVVLGLLMVPLTARVTNVRVTVIGPVLLVFALLGSYAIHNLMSDVIVTLVFAVLGYSFKRFGFSTVAVILGLVLGPIMERSYHLTLETMGPAAFFTRPISLGMGLLILVMFLWVLLSSRKRTSNTSPDYS